MTKTGNSQKTDEVRQHTGNPVVVISHGSGVNGLAIVRSIGRLGISVYVIAKEGTINLASRSRYCSKAYWIEDEEAGFLKDALDKILAQTKYIPVLFCDSDEAVYLASTCAEWLEHKFILPYPLSRFQELQDKEYQAKKAIAAGIPVPRSWYVNTWEDVASIESAGIKRRLLVKPNPQSFAMSAPFKVFWADNPRSMAEQLRAIVTTPEGMIVQEFIDGEDECMWVVSGYRAINKERIVSLTMMKTKQSGSGAGGVGIIVQTRDNPELRQMAAEFLNETGYVGPFAMEFKYCKKEKKYYFVENNFRTARIHVIGRRMGADLPKIIYADVTKQYHLYNEDQQTPRKMWYYDIAGCLRTLPQTREPRVIFDMIVNMLAAPFRTKEWAVHAWDDIAPTIVSTKELSRELLERLGRKICRIVLPGRRKKTVDGSLLNETQ